MLAALALPLAACGGRSGLHHGREDGGADGRADIALVDAGSPDTRIHDQRAADQVAPPPDLGPVPKAWSVTFGGSTASQINAISVARPDAVFLTGAYSGKAKFGPHTCSSLGSYDLYLARLGKDGGFQWVICGGGAGYDGGLDLAQGLGGDLWLSGEFNGPATLGGVALSSAGSSDLFLARVTPTGKVRWVVTGGGAGLDKGTAVRVDPATGDAFVAGSATLGASFGKLKLKASGLQNSFFARVSPAGSFVWAVGAASDTWSRPVAMARSAKGALFVAGNFGSRVTLGGHILKGTATAHGYLARLDSAGKVTWALAATGPAHTELTAMDTDASGALHVTGTYKGQMALGTLKAPGPTGSNLFNRAFVARLSPAGAGAWLLTDTGNGLTMGQSRVVRASQTAAGPLYLLATSNSPYDLGGFKIKDKGPFLARITAAGQATWSQSLLPHDAHLLALDAMGGVYLASNEILTPGLRLYKLTP